MQVTKDSMIKKSNRQNIKKSQDPRYINHATVNMVKFHSNVKKHEYSKQRNFENNVITHQLDFKLWLGFLKGIFHFLRKLQQLCKNRHCTFIYVFSHFWSIVNHLAVKLHQVSIIFTVLKFEPFNGGP